MIYLDWAASAVPQRNLFEQAYRETAALFANPSASHPLGKKAHDALEQARRRCAAVLDVAPETLYFTSGGSESNSLVLLSLLTRPAAGSVAISMLEHPSIRQQALMLKNCGWDILSIPSDRNGQITAEAVLNTVREDTHLTAVMTVNNEIGAIQPIAEISAALQNREASRPIHFHTDAVQAFGKVPLNQLALPLVHSASMSAHKIGGPRGIGLLYLRHPFNSFIRGGSQERNIRPGTENVIGACALAACLEAAYTSFSGAYIEAEQNIQFFIDELRKIPDCTVIPAQRKSVDSHFVPWIVQCSFKHIPSEVMMRCLAEHDIYVSAGSACSSKHKTRPILAALGADAACAQNTIRISIGPSTERYELEQCITALQAICASC